MEVLLLAVIFWLVLEAAAGSVSPRMRASVGREGQPNDNAAVSAVTKPGKQLGVSYYVGKLTHQGLFGHDRNERRHQQALDVRKSARELLSEFEIQGVVQGRRPVVILFEKAKLRTLTVGVGESVGGMEVLKINGNTITFELLGEAYEVKF
jgi:hypothetical protein